jgi:plastocyanin
MKPANTYLAHHWLYLRLLQCNIHLMHNPPMPSRRALLQGMLPHIPADAADGDVKIENFTFEPKELEIAVGTTVTWQNADDVPHTATSKDDPQTFDSGPLDTDDKFSFTFSKPGKYAYYCKVHPHMTGVITVK